MSCCCCSEKSYEGVDSRTPDRSSKAPQSQNMRRDDDSDHRAVDKWRCRSHAALSSKAGESNSTDVSTPDRSTSTPVQLSPAATRSWRERAELNESHPRSTRRMSPGDAYRGPVDLDTGVPPSDVGTGASTSYGSAWSWSVEQGVEVDELSGVRAKQERTNESPTNRPDSDNGEAKPPTPRILQPMLDDCSYMEEDPDARMATIDPVEVDELDKIVMAIQDKDYSVEDEASLISSVLSSSSKSKKKKRPSTLSPKMSPTPSRKPSPRLIPSDRDSPPRRKSPSNSQSRPAQSSHSEHSSKSGERGRDSPTPRRSPSPMEAAAAALAAADQIHARKSPTPSSQHRRSPSPTDYRKIEASLSDIPSDVDSDTKERYLMACRLLKSTLIEKEKVLLPTEKCFLQELLDQDESSLSKADIAAIETASQTLISDPMFSMDSVQSSSLSEDDIVVTREPWPPFSSEKKRAGSPVSKVSDKTPKIRNKDVLDEYRSDVPSTVTFGGRDFPFSILGVKNTDVGVLTPSLMEALRSFFPFRVAQDNFWLKYSLEHDGPSLPYLLSKVRTSKHTIIGVETADGHVFGAFCSTPWRVHSSWFGSGDSFLWRLKKSRLLPGSNERNFDKDNEMEVYPFTGHDKLIQYCTRRTIAVGGGNWSEDQDSPYQGEPTGIGFMVDGDLMGGETNSCATFDNPRLCGRSSKSNEFDIYGLEAWTITPCDSIEEAERLEMHRTFIEEHSKNR